MAKKMFKMAKKMFVKIHVFCLATEPTGSCGSFIDGYVCHISLNAYRFINKNIELYGKVLQSNIFQDDC